VKINNRIHILVSGSQGQLGSELRAISKLNKEFNISFKNSRQLDLSSEESIKENLTTKNIDYFINAGAYTAVDLAERNEQQAFKVNSEALNLIGKHALPTTQVIHLSSDYVYNLDIERPLLELQSKEFLTVDDTSKILNISRSTIWRMMKEDQIKYQRLRGRIIFLKSDLYELFQ